MLVLHLICHNMVWTWTAACLVSLVAFVYRVIFYISLSSYFVYCRLCTFGRWRNQRILNFVWNCQSFTHMMMLLRELPASLDWMIQQKFALHPITAIRNSLNRNTSDIRVWNIYWKCSSTIIRHLTSCITKYWIFHCRNCSSLKPLKLHSTMLQRRRLLFTASGFLRIAPLLM